jgi:hypothetical protein
MLDDRRGHLERALERLPKRHVAFRLPSGDIVDMVLKFAADGGTIEHYVDAVRLEVIGRADSRQHQDLRAVERPRG